MRVRQNAAITLAEITIIRYLRLLFRTEPPSWRWFRYRTTVHQRFDSDRSVENTFLVLGQLCHL